MEASKGVNKGRKHKCSFIGCNNSKQHFPHLHFFSFPTSRQEICNQWLVNCANGTLLDVPISKLKGKVVCERHFTADSFTSNLKTRLHQNAIPSMYAANENTINPLTSPRVSSQPGPSTSQSPTVAGCRKTLFPSGDTDTSTPPYKKFKSSKDRKPTPYKKPVTPGKTRLLKRLQSYQMKTKNYKEVIRKLKAKLKKRVIPLPKTDIISSLQHYLPENVADFFEMQLLHSRKKIKWSENEKKKILAMRFKSPTFYDYLRKEGYFLPCLSTISRWLSKIKLRPGLSTDLMVLLHTKIKSMSSWERKAVVMIDEMSIKKSLDYDPTTDTVEGVRDLGERGRHRTPGTGVLMVMARGLIHKWKMPIAYYVVNKTVTSSYIKEIIQDSITELVKAGLDVKAIVCDQGSTNRKASTLLGVDPKKPFFMVGDRKIFWIFDFPHILKCLRNNLMKTNKQGEFIGQVYTSKGVADWKHVVALYDLDTTSTSARATKLSLKHIRPNNFEKMTVKLAAQVFSHTTSVAMKTAVECGQLPVEALETACFLQGLNDVFDAMNSRAKFDPNPNRCAVSESCNEHLSQPLKTITNSLEWAKTWKMRGTRPPSFHGLELTLTSTVMLWNDVRKEGVEYLLTGRLNQDPLENEFSISRQKCGYNRNPSAKMFRLNMRHRIQSALLRPSSGGNCEPDEDEMLPVVREVGGRSATTSMTAKQDVEGCAPGMIQGSSCSSDSDSSDDEEEDGIFQMATNTLESCAARYFAGYAVRCCLEKFKCNFCKTELSKEPPKNDSQILEDEKLVINREYKRIGSLTYPSDLSVDATKLALAACDKVFNKSLHQPQIVNRILRKTKQYINFKSMRFLQFDGSCNNHRVFFLKKVIVAKVRRHLCDISKDMRQPHSKTCKSVNKLVNLSNA